MNAIEEKELQRDRQRILYDGSLEEIDPESWPDLFEPAFLEKNNLVNSTAAGRGQVYFFSHGPLKLVLRHYRRGGLLGKEHATVIAEAKGIPILADVRGEEAQKIAQEISEKFQVPALGMGIDITRQKEVARLLDVSVDKFQRIDILINNAANDPKVGGENKNSHWSRFENFPLASNV